MSINAIESIKLARRLFYPGPVISMQAREALHIGFIQHPRLRRSWLNIRFWSAVRWLAHWRRRRTGQPVEKIKPLFELPDVVHKYPWLRAVTPPPEEADDVEAFIARQQADLQRLIGLAEKEPSPSLPSFTAYRRLMGCEDD